MLEEQILGIKILEDIIEKKISLIIFSRSKLNNYRKLKYNYNKKVKKQINQRMQAYSPQNILYFIICMFSIFNFVEPQIVKIEQPVNKSSSVSLFELIKKRNQDKIKNQVVKITQFSVEQIDNGTLIMKQQLNFRPGSNSKGSIVNPITIINTIDQNNLVSGDQLNQTTNYPPESSIFQPLKLKPQSLSKPSLPDNFSDNSTYIQTATSPNLLPINLINDNPPFIQPQPTPTARQPTRPESQPASQSSGSSGFSSGSVTTMSVNRPSVNPTAFDQPISTNRFVTINIPAITVFTQALFPLFFKFNRPQVKVKTNYEFDNFAFYHPIPTAFIQGETFRYQGVVTNQDLISSHGLNVIVMFFIDQTTNDYIICREKQIINLQFNISCQMKKPGRYKMYMFLGNIGKSTPLLRKVNGFTNLIKQSFPQPTEPRPRGLRLQYHNNSLYVFWDSRANLTNLTIFQQRPGGGLLAKRQYILSNNHQRFRVPFQDFEEFQTKTTYVQISHAMTLDATLGIIYTKFTSTKERIQFEATNHSFANKNSIIYMKPEIPWRMKVGEKFNFNISFSFNIKRIFYICYPDLRIVSSTFSSIQDQKNKEFIKAGTNLNIQLSFSTPGVHILQINDVRGAATLNRPIYVGQAYPLIPDYTDLTPQRFLAKKFPSITIPFTTILRNYYEKTTQKLKTQQPPLSSSIEQKRQYLLTLINGLRKKYNVPVITLDQSLTLIAQNHTDDMILKDYVAHENKEGQFCQQRAKKMNFKYRVQQNIAQTDFLIDNHLGLQRSAGHLETIVNRAWGRVGIGINRTQNAIVYQNFIKKYGNMESIPNLYLITYVYSIRDLNKFPITSQQQQKYKNQCIDAIQQKNPKIKNYDENISTILKQWMESDRKIRLNNYFKQNRNLVKKKSFLISGIGVGLKFSDDWVERMMKSSEYLVGNVNDQTDFGLYFFRNQDMVELYVVFV